MKYQFSPDRGQLLGSVAVPEHCYQ